MLTHKRRSIIVEGMDASGKSTLANKLSEHYGIYCFSAGPKPTGMIHAEVCMRYQLEWLKNTSCVWDRITPISNVCNLPKLAKQSQDIHAYYAKSCLYYGAIVVCTTENLDTHEKAVYESDEDIKSMLADRQIVANNYKKMAHDLPNVIRYDFRLRRFASLLEELDAALSISL